MAEGDLHPIRQTVDVEVRYAETDQMGVVHHSVYLVWFEQARTRLCLESGYHYAEIEEKGFFLVVTGSQCRYLGSATYGHSVTVTCWLERLSSRLLRFAYEVHQGDELLTSGATEHVWVSKATGRPCRIPEFLKAPFARLAGHPTG